MEKKPDVVIAAETLIQVHLNARSGVSLLHLWPERRSAIL